MIVKSLHIFSAFLAITLGISAYWSSLDHAYFDPINAERDALLDKYDGGSDKAFNFRLDDLRESRPDFGQIYAEYKGIYNDQMGIQNRYDDYAIMFAAVSLILAVVVAGELFVLLAPKLGIKLHGQAVIER